MSKLVLAAAAALFLTSPALAAPASAGADDGAPAKVVSAQGVNFADPAQAQGFYDRLQEAVREVCSSGDKLVMTTEDITCERENMRQAVRAVNAPVLTALLDKGYGLGAPSASAFAADAR